MHCDRNKIIFFIRGSPSRQYPRLYLKTGAVMVAFYMMFSIFIAQCM